MGADEGLGGLEVNSTSVTNLENAPDMGTFEDEAVDELDGTKRGFFFEGVSSYSIRSEMRSIGYRIVMLTVSRSASLSLRVGLRTGVNCNPLLVSPWLLPEHMK